MLGGPSDFLLWHHLLLPLLMKQRDCSVPVRSWNLSCYHNAHHQLQPKGTMGTTLWDTDVPSLMSCTIGWGRKLYHLGFLVLSWMNSSITSIRVQEGKFLNLKNRAWLPDHTRKFGVFKLAILFSLQIQSPLNERTPGQLQTARLSIFPQHPPKRTGAI